MSFEEFYDSCHGDHLGFMKETILAILILHVSPYTLHQVLVQSVMVWKEKFEEFQEGRHLGY